MMRRILYAVALAASVAVRASDAPPRIDSLEETRAAAAKVSVGTREIVVPSSERESSDLLSETFFNTPEEKQFAGVTDREWRAKWAIFSEALLARAGVAGLDKASLSRSLTALNEGRNEKTIYGVIINEPIDADDATRARIRDEERKRNQQLLEDARAEPGKHSEGVATVPVGAYLARYEGGSCWLIVCKWEYESTDDESSSLGHTRVWAVDAGSGKFVAYVTCD